MLCRLSRLRSPSLSFSLTFLSSVSSTSNPNPNRTPKLLRRKIQKPTSSDDNSATGGDRRILPAVISLPSSPTDPIASSIVSLLSEPSDPPRTLDDLLKQFKNNLTSDLVLQVLKNYRRLGRFKTLDFFSWSGFQLEFCFDDPVVEYMADFLGRRKLFDDLKCLLKTVASRRGHVSSRSVAICIRFLGRQGRIMDVLALFERMELEFSCSPDNLVFNNVLYVLCRKDPQGDSIDAALLIFHRIGKPDVFSYSNIIIGLCRFGRLENAIKVFHEMRIVHLVPTRTAANILIRQLCEFGGKIEIVEKVKVTSVRRPFEILVPNVGAKSSIKSAVHVFWAILELGLVPSGHAINALITVLCKLQSFEEAVEILKMVGNRKLRCIDESYVIVMRELCKVCRMSEACGLFEGMLSQGLRPKIAVYNSLIKMLCNLRCMEEAKKYYHIMKQRRCEPDCATYNMLIHAYSAIESWEPAYELLIEMIEMGWHPHFDSYSLVNGLLIKNARLDLSLKLERKMDAQLLHAHCKAGRVDAAYDKLKSMLGKGFYPPIYAKYAFERAFRRAGKWKIACDIFNKMDQIGIQNMNNLDI